MSRHLSASGQTNSLRYADVCRSIGLDNCAHLDLEIEIGNLVDTLPILAVHSAQIPLSTLLAKETEGSTTARTLSTSEDGKITVHLLPRDGGPTPLQLGPAFTAVNGVPKALPRIGEAHNPTRPGLQAAHAESTSCGQLRASNDPAGPPSRAANRPAGEHQSALPVDVGPSQVLGSNVSLPDGSHGQVGCLMPTHTMTVALRREPVGSEDTGLSPDQDGSHDLTDALPLSDELAHRNGSHVDRASNLTAGLNDGNPGHNGEDISLGAAILIRPGRTNINLGASGPVATAQGIGDGGDPSALLAVAYADSLAPGDSGADRHTENIPRGVGDSSIAMHRHANSPQIASHTGTEILDKLFLPAGAPDEMAEWFSSTGASWRMESHGLDTDDDPPPLPPLFDLGFVSLQPSVYASPPP